MADYPHSATDPEGQPWTAERLVADQLLHAIATAVETVSNPAAMAQRCVDLIHDHLAMDAVHLYWWDAEDEVLASLAYNDPRTVTPLPVMHAGQGITGTAFARHEPVVVDDYERSGYQVAWGVAQRIETGAAVPLLLGGEAHGVILALRYTRRAFTTADMRLLTQVGARVTPTLAGMRLVADAERRRAQAETLADLVRQGAAQPDIDHVISLVTEYAGRLLGADYTAIALREADGTAAWRGMWGMRSSVWRSIRHHRNEGAAGRLGFVEQTVLVEHLGENPEYPLGELPIIRAEGARTVLVIPLSVHDQTFGVLELGWRTEITLHPSRVRLAETLASYAATIIDRAGAMEALQTSERLLRTAVSSVPIILVALDRNGIFTLVAGQGLALLERDAGDYVGRSAFAVLESIPSLLECTRAALEGRQAETMLEIRGRMLEARLVPTHDERGQRAGAIGVCVDVTDRVRAHQQSEYARVAAEELARSRSSFVAAISHELRTPLTAILGFTEILKGHWTRISDEQRLAQIGRIAIAAQRQHRLVEDLLLLNQLDDQPITVHLKPIVLSALVRLVAAEIQDLYPGQRIDLEGPGRVVVLADRERLAQVLAGLVDNAAKHSPEGKPVAVSWQIQGARAEVRVRDHGPGMTEQGRAQLFTRFGRIADGPIRAGRVGIGLGLFLGRCLAEAMDGTLELESTSARGSVFRVCLPLAHARAGG